MIGFKTSTWWLITACNSSYRGSRVCWLIFYCSLSRWFAWIFLLPCECGGNNIWSQLSRFWESQASPVGCYSFLLGSTDKKLLSEFIQASPEITRGSRSEILSLWAQNLPMFAAPGLQTAPPPHIGFCLAISYFVGIFLADVLCGQCPSVPAHAQTKGSWSLTSCWGLICRVLLVSF